MSARTNIIKRVYLQKILTKNIRLDKCNSQCFPLENLTKNCVHFLFQNFCPLPERLPSYATDIVNENQTSHQMQSTAPQRPSITAIPLYIAFRRRI